jgi:hypothetical protein
LPVGTEENQEEYQVSPCILVNRYRRFGGTYCLNLQEKIMEWKQQFPPKCWYQVTKVHLVTSKKSVMLVTSLYRTSDPYITAVWASTSPVHWEQCLAPDIVSVPMSLSVLFPQMSLHLCPVLKQPREALDLLSNKPHHTLACNINTKQFKKCKFKLNCNVRFPQRTCRNLISLACLRRGPLPDDSKNGLCQLNDKKREVHLKSV